MKLLVTFAAYATADICAQPEEDPDYQVCEGKVTEKYTECVIGCDNDPSCLSACNREYVENLGKCPCQEGCPDGCPCPEYECPSRDSVLILSTYSDLNKPLLTDINGRKDYIDFTYEPDTEAFGSCSVKFENRFYVFGGRDEPRQISQIQDCKLSRVGSLEFDFFYGACASTGSEVVLCFDEMRGDFTWCASSTNPVSSSSWADIERTTFSHKRVRIASSSEMIFAVGSYEDHANAEILPLESGSWTAVASYPFAKSISLAPMVKSFDPFVFYILGGWNTVHNDALSTVAKFNAADNEWTKIGELQSARWAHAAIYIPTDDKFVVVGGKQIQTSYVQTEICTLGDGNTSILCTAQTPQLYDHMYYPELFNVENDYCT